MLNWVQHDANAARWQGLPPAPVLLKMIIVYKNRLYVESVWKVFKKWDRITISVNTNAILDIKTNALSVL